MREFKEILVIVAIVVIFIFALLKSADFYKNKAMMPFLSALKSRNFDVNEVRIFCKIYDYSLEDFLDSKVLQKQYEFWIEGGDIDFMKQIKAKKDKEEARSSGVASGLAAGMLMGVNSK